MRTTATIATIALTITVITAGTAQAQTDGVIEIQDGNGVRDAHRALQWSTIATMGLTATIGTIIAMNKPTLFSEGRCETGDPIFGEYGCRGLSVLHGISAIVTIIAYTATTAVEFAAFDWPGQEEHGTAFDVASGVHLAGMATIPFIGLIGAVPQVLGIDPNDESFFQKVLRTIHLSLATLTVGTYITTAAIDLD